ncbi:MAG: PP2C family protein-serine/threonine phosphatase [Gemmatimonadaceae bacterium]
MIELHGVLSAFLESTGCGATVWVEHGATPLRVDATDVDHGPLAQWTPTFRTGPPSEVDSPGGRLLLATVPGPRRAWLAVGPCSVPDQPLDRFLRFLLPVVSQYLQADLEVEHAANELAERYEEINLLYTITEILGRTVSLEEAAARILKEVSETVGARRGSILVHDRVTDTLQSVAVLPGIPTDLAPIALTDPSSISARVFREQRSVLAEPGGVPCPAESSYRVGIMLSVPIMWTMPNGGSEPLGVVNLSDRRSGEPFSAGDQKLVAAIATQIGTAIQNTRLVRASLSQQRLVRELELAHEMQMKLLPRTSVVAPEAQVAARVMPAESVGGDFYNLFRLTDGRTGVMIGDVSSHGYQAALIMALALSASAIHAQSSRDPGDMLAALLSTLREELESTEMFISAFYAVIDRDAGILRYANTGHPHAWLIDEEGLPCRLSAIDPPLGMVEERPTAKSRVWNRGKDILLLFTDGVSDARDRFGGRLGEQRVVDLVARYRTETPDVILDRLADELSEHTGETQQRDDITIVVLRS